MKGQECRWRATHEFDADGLCRFCFAPRPTREFPWWEGACEVMLTGTDGRELQNVLGYERAQVAAGVFRLVGLQVFNVQRIEFPTPTGPWGWILGVRMRSLEGKQSSPHSPLVAPTFVGPGTRTGFDVGSVTWNPAVLR